jgi:hypothetical protein
LKSPIFPDLACGLGSAAEQIQENQKKFPNLAADPELPIPDHKLNQEILDFSMWNSPWKVAFEQDLSIGAIFSGKKYSDVPFFRRAVLRG